MPTLAFDVFWRDHGAARGVKDLGDNARNATGHVQTLGSHGKQLAAGFAGFAAAQIFHSFISGARESNMIARVTEQRIRSTGGAAHVTADQVGDLATSISNKTGADDEAIQSGENMLLTFTNIRNEVGKGNDIFNQASETVVDLAAAMNNGEVSTDGVKTASIQLGKALNDPIKGITALQKVGVTFTNQQKSQIKTLVQSGDALGAQKIILSELNKEFGGTARAAADPLQRMSVILGNVGEDLGNKLLPALDRGADVLAAIPGPVYMAVGSFVALGAGAIGVAKAVNAVKDISQGTAGLLRVLGIRTAEVAAAETVQAAAARGSAVSTAAAGDAAAVAGTKFGSLAGKLAIGGAVVGLAAVSAEATSWLGRSEVTKVSTDQLADAFLHLRDGAKAPQPAIDAVSSATDKWYGKVQSSNDVMNQFAGLARGAFSMGWADIIGRAQSGTERVDRFNGVAAQMDAALAQLVRNGHGIEAAQQFDELMRSTGLAGEELQHVKNRFGQYQAAAAEAARQTDATTRAIGDENSVLVGVQRGGNVATNALHAVTGATNAATAAAHRHRDATAAELKAMDANADQVLNLRAADRSLAQARADLTDSIKTNKRGLDLNTAAGRANSDALDRVARSTRDDLAAHRAANEPMARYTQRVRQSESALIAEARRAGMSEGAARRYARAILAVPRRQVVDYQTRGAAAAQKAARDLNYFLQHIRSTSVRVHINADGNYVQGSRVLAAKGGPIPGGMGRRGVDSVPALLMPDEHVWTTRETAAVGGHSAMLRLRKLALAGQLQGYAAGGPVNRHALTIYDERLPSNAFMQARINRIVARGVGGFQPAGMMGPIPGGTGVARWAGVILSALRLLGLSSGWLGTVERRMGRESGGNPRAVNLWDINAQRGYPSVGLMQVIRGTFQAYAGRFRNVGPFMYGVSVNPLANTYAGLNYAVHRYGSLSALNRAGGYDRGGVARYAGLVPKFTNQPERWLSPRQTAAFERLVPMLERSGGRVGPTEIVIRVEGSAMGLEDRVVGAVRKAVSHGRMSSAVLPGGR